jgi:hypothetical protein
VTAARDGGVNAGLATCYLGQVSVRHAALSIGAALVLGLGVYLFVEVRAQPSPGAGPARAAPGVERAAPPVPANPPAAARVEPQTRAVAAPPVAPPLAAPAAPPPGSSPAPSLAGSDGPLAALDAPGPIEGPRLEAVMAEANKAYDHGEYDDAKSIASRLLARQPGNVRMLRIMVSASCLDGDAPAAQASYARLPPADQAQMRIRCARYGVAFADKP